ncbi:MAG: pyrroline-5-carboxylate reductase [Myxococcales bacterium]|nr:MAG: pyrroline-5-carboxylate reductase [Myxococcales bacterium]
MNWLCSADFETRQGKTKMNIGIIGAGVMGEVITSSLLKKNVVAASQIMIADALPEKPAALAKTYGIRHAADNREVTAFADIVIFSVKPQNSRAMMEPLSGAFHEGQVIVSIMAGVSLGTIERLTGHKELVRAMPNIPAKIGEGMTVWIASPSVPDCSKMIVKMIFQAFGLETEVTNEDLIDAATAISGSGPAYIFYVAENLMKSALELGFDNREAHRLVQQTFRGAMDLWHHTGEEPETLRRSVTSKGGTTAAALKTFGERKTPESFSAAIHAAYVRAGQLREIADGKPDPAADLEKQS